MKRLLVALLLTLTVFAASSQVLGFRTTSYQERQLTGYGWTGWSSPQGSNMTLTIDLDNDIVKIYSPRTQTYRIISYEGTYMDSDGDQTAKYKFIDQDGDRGTMRLVMRRNGKSEVYIDFANVMWVYSVVRTY